MAALIAVPLPLRIPVTEVANVRLGVAPPLEVPVNPLELAIEIDVTYVPAGCLLLKVFQSVELK